jgi:MFS family permease
LLSVDWMTGRAGATYLILGRVVQGIGGAFIAANSGAIITDAFPATQRGFALGINNVSSIAGRFIGLVLGGLLAAISWRLVFFVSVPFGLFGTIWSYTKLQERGIRRRAPVDWWGNVTFGVGLVLVMIAITYGIQPYDGHVMGWTNPKVITEMAVGVGLLALFLWIESRVEHPMFHLRLFRIRAFTFGTLSSFLSALARGGLMFMLIIWLQGIWLPLHGYSYSDTPLWAGIAMLPLSLGILIAGPISGFLSDRYGDLFERHRHRSLRVAQPRCGDEQSPTPAPRCRERYEHDVPELGPGPLHRGLLFPDDRRAVVRAIEFARIGAARPGRLGVRRHPRRPPAAGVGAVRCVPRIQPDSAPARGPDPRQLAVVSGRPALEPEFLPVADRRPLPVGFA